jgi:hypothetical protein
MVDVDLPNVWMLDVEQDERGWSLVQRSDGTRRVISRHPTRDDAQAAKDAMNAVSQPGVGGSNDPARVTGAD